MRTFNKITLFALALIIAFGMVGCQPKTQAGPVTIHVLTMDQAGLKPAEIDQIARDFEAQNPDIKVVMEYVGYDYVHDKIVTGMAATPPGLRCRHDRRHLAGRVHQGRIPAGCDQPGHARHESRHVPGLLERRDPQWQDLRHALADGREVFHVQQGYA